jgi:hypothetical protein
VRREIGIAIGAAAAAAALAAVAYRFLRGRTAEPLALPPARAPSVPASDEPLARETRFDENLHEEEERRHEAAERLKTDPFSEQLDNGA